MCFSLIAQLTEPININKFKSGIQQWSLDYPENDYERYDVSEVIEIANNLVKWQNRDGGWSKNIDWLGMFDIDSLRPTLEPHYHKSSLENTNIFPQIAYLSEAFTQTKNPIYRNAAERGIRYLIVHQHANGGWGEHAITFNDEVMTGIMNLFLEIRYHRPIYSWVKEPLLSLVNKSLDKAIAITLKCQAENNGEKTAWYQQYDYKTLQPQKTGDYEEISLSTVETCDILLFLMRIRNPSPEEKTAIKSGVEWLKKSQIAGTRPDAVQSIYLEWEKIHGS
jgi:PelA/Pel-15E family pectate lyase